MNGTKEVTYAADFGGRRKDYGRPPHNRASETDTIPRISRLMALAIRLDRLIREQTLPDFAEVARRGRVTRARVTQIMHLLNLAPDLQERILFLPPYADLKERNLRSLVRCVDWAEQRRRFKELIQTSRRGDGTPPPSRRKVES